jgi:hypothetical protein
VFTSEADCILGVQALSPNWPTGCAEGCSDGFVTLPEGGVVWNGCFFCSDFGGVWVGGCCCDCYPGSTNTDCP